MDETKAAATRVQAALPPPRMPPIPPQQMSAEQKAAVADLFDYIELFYSRKRLHSTLGYVSSVKFLKNWISAQHEKKLAA